MAETDKSQANVLVTIDGETTLQTHTREGEIDTFSGITILRVHVDQRLDCPDLFTVDYELIIDMALTYIDSIQEGQEVEISLGYENRGNMPVIFIGEVTSIEPTFGRNGATLSISGYDYSHRLTRGTMTKSFDSSDSASIDLDSVIETVVADSSSMSGKSDNLSLKLDSKSAGSPPVWNVSQLATNNYQFLQGLGRGIGYAHKSQSDNPKVLSVGKVEMNSPVLTVVRDLPDGENPVPAIEARFKLNTARQVSKVEVRGWDPGSKSNIVGTAEHRSLDFSDPGTDGGESTSKAIYGKTKDGKKLVVVDHPVESQEEATLVAQSILDDLSMEFITGEAEFEGVPTLRAGDVIQFMGYGDRFDGPYLVTSCQHIYSPGEGAYTCRVEVQRNYTRDAE